MIAVDTNILVYAHRADLPLHAAARQALNGLVQADALWAIPWPCVHEFFAVTTNPKAFSTPTPPSAAMEALTELFNGNGATPIGETTDHLRQLTSLVGRSRIAGPKIHDARIAAICLSHGIRQLWTADRDFSYFPTLSTHNPLISD